MTDQLLIGAILLAALALFIWDKWRYDLVAMLALLAAAVFGLVPAAEVFTGFGNPAVITVAAVLIISHAMWRSGVVDALASLMKRVGDNSFLQMVALTGLTTLCSAFISNTGTMAIMIPVALQLSRSGLGHASKVLMPMAFGSLLGGTITMIGTPPNIIIADIRQAALGTSFGIFDFTPVGLTLALVGLVFMWIFSRILVPSSGSRNAANSPYDMSSYLTELYVPAGAALISETLYEFETKIKDSFAVVAVKQGKQVITAPPRYYRIKQEDVLIIEADTETLQKIIDATGFELNADEELDQRFLVSDDIQVVEGVVGPDSRLIGRSAADLRIRHRFGVNVLAVARQGQPVKPNLANIRFKPGDVLLLQGDAEVLADVFRRFGCFPLAQRSMRIGGTRKLFTPLIIFAVAITFSALGWLSVPVAFTAAAGAMVFANIIPLRELYENIDWPIVVLLGATIPLGSALERSGAAATLADWALHISSGAPAAVAMVVLLIVTVALSNVVNNAAAAVLMAPIGLSMASTLGVSADPFLMAVAIGAALPFMTPIGHQSNILVMGPGGYAFGDYWKLGLPLTLLIIAVAVPLILWVWPLSA
ncbi:MULTISPECIES: SLC13 family permease [Pseudidiomarina]|uniref:Di/tricarboxylate transporter n=2 Tax=Pseudidiomarina TaxID=2800384 RepID=A0A368URZ4_9GAMM|nr:MULTISPECIES: SLC13 family permease [Pseudidiomarina]PWW09768.1 di/tricarboxylate transporter [Pseudidiomarina maritima]RBP87552.1 di/tricarboxylate transporter [Pseudidiomarina tainanensis]RCW29611.1 di/tricarboxylate transporter [Pseudidiomarina tainanensis]